MKLLPRLLLLLLAGGCIFGARRAEEHQAIYQLSNYQEVNAVVGDASYLNRFGQPPTATTPDFVRVQTHLAYAERQLRQATPASLPPTQRQRRAHLLALLHRYWQAGIFPSNEAPDGQRHPCFLDRAGRVCAVGYLLERTAGLAAVERLNARFPYRALPTIRDQALSRWVAGNGISLAELALIQPTYAPAYQALAQHVGFPTPSYGLQKPSSPRPHLTDILSQRTELQ